MTTTRKNKKGSAIAYSLMLIAAVTIIMTSIVRFVVVKDKAALVTEQSEQSFQVAEAGIEWYRWYLSMETVGKTSAQVGAFWQSTSPYPLGLGNNSPYTAEYYDPSGGKIGKYSIVVTPPAANSTIVMVTSQGWTYQNPGLIKTIQVRFRRPSWSEYAVLGNAYQRFGDGTTISGPLFVNGGIQFDGVAKNKVYSSVSTYVDSDTGVNVTEPGVWTSWAGGYNTNMASNVFLAGKSFPVAAEDFNGLVSDLSYMRSQAVASGIKYDNTGGGRYISLQANGTFNMCKVNTFGATSNDILTYAGVVSNATSGNGTACTTATASCCTGLSCPWINSGNHNKGVCSSMTNTAIPANGMIFVANNVWIDGTINNKRVTVVAAELPDENSSNFPGDTNYTGGNKNIFLGTGNILYTNNNGNDIIGLVAQNNVEVFQDSSTNLIVDAALLAINGRVGRNAYGLCRSSITINGAIATNTRYGFAYIGGTNYCGGTCASSTDGYCTRNLNYDNNLLYYPPPFFPTGTQYAIDLWQEL